MWLLLAISRLSPLALGRIIHARGRLCFCVAASGAFTCQSTLVVSIQIDAMMVGWPSASKPMMMEAKNGCGLCVKGRSHHHHTSQEAAAGQGANAHSNNEGESTRNRDQPARREGAVVAAHGRPPERPGRHQEHRPAELGASGWAVEPWSVLGRRRPLGAARKRNMMDGIGKQQQQQPAAAAASSSQGRLWS